MSLICPLKKHDLFIVVLILDCIYLRHMFRSRVLSHIFEYFFRERPIFLQTSPTCSELPSYISTMLFLFMTFFIPNNVYQKLFVDGAISKLRNTLL